MAYGQPIALRDFSPDLDHMTPGVLTDCDGFYGSLGGVRTLPSFVAVGTSLPAPSLGTFSAELPTGQRIVVAGTSTHLYRFTGAGWVEFDGGQTFHLRTGRWSFAVFGFYILAVNGIDPDQVSAFGNAFQPLNNLVTTVGKAPVASIVDVTDVAVFLVLPASNTVEFSISPFAWFDPSTANANTGFQTFQQPLTGTQGTITAAHRIRGGIVIYKRESMYFGQFIGPPFFWAFTSISENVGTRNQDAVINAGDVHLFLGPDDFYLFDGSSLQRLPNNLRKWFFKRAAPASLDEVLGVWNREHSLAMWFYSSIDAEPSGARDEWLAYNVRTAKWMKGSAAALGADEVADVVAPNFLITNDLTYAQFGARFVNYNNPLLNIAYNDQSLGEELVEVQGVLDSTGQLLLATGAPKNAFIQTWEITDGANYYLLSRVRPIFYQSPVDRYAHLQCFKRRMAGYPIPDTAPLPVGGVGPQAVLTKDGAFNILVTNRSHQLKIAVTSECEISSLALDLTQAGTE